MGLFNTLIIDQKCARCAAEIELRVQFKFGNTRQHEYRLGEALRWQGNRNDIGRPGLGHVAIEAISEGCPRCGSSSDFELEILDDRIVGARAVDDVARFVGIEDDWIVIS